VPNYTSRPWITAALALGAAGSLAAVACKDDGTSPRDAQRRVYGDALAVGNGRARTYVVVDANDASTPLEVGVALDEAAMDGLPAPMAMPPSTSDDPHNHVDTHVYDLAMPAGNPSPYKFVELDWNPAGHEPPGIYDIPHFDFHFYTVSKAERDAIDPAALGAAFNTKSAALPAQDFRAPDYVPLAAPGAPIVAVPHMGVHWSDTHAPELQAALGHPEANRTFTTTFIHGSWDGKFIFDEPMITRAYIMGRKTATAAAQRDSLMTLATPTRTTAGLTPSAYRVTYDADAKEYRIALTQFVRK